MKNKPWHNRRPVGGFSRGSGRRCGILVPASPVTCRRPRQQEVLQEWREVGGVSHPGLNTTHLDLLHVSLNLARRDSTFTATKGCPTRQHTPPNTRAHGITATPILDHPHGPVPQPSQRYKPHSLLDWTRENDGSKKTQKCGNTGKMTRSVTRFYNARIHTIPR